MFGKNSLNTTVSHDQQDLMDHPEYLNAFFSKGPVIFSIFNHKSLRFCYISPNVKNILGISPEELIAMDCQDFLRHFMHPDDLKVISCELFPDIADFIRKNLKKRLASISVHYNYRIKTAAGYWIKIEQQTTPLDVDENGILNLDQSFNTQVGKGDFRETFPIKLQIFLKDVNGLFNEQFCRTYMSKKAGLNSLTPREMQILKMLTKGLTSHKMADLLNISETTIITHKRNMLRKFCLKNTNELVSWGYEKGIL